MNSFEQTTRKRQDEDVVQIRISGNLHLADLIKKRMLELFGDWVVEAGQFYRNRFDVGSRCYVSMRPPEGPQE